ncbi:hypothetical protein BUALT_Bualt10G0042900 [Buddleja alternifolia]|uniref:glutamate--cysteine ligase n=1 Tax=Buddleja alternifolia TaxID=168488 RepID=A0AAV6X2K7_9LAMI|nr:hypothetical protein BUALT_Bualt10G0042900 [Buddleja alternifolia]
MALMSQTGSSHCIQSELIHCKARHNGPKSIANTMETTKTKAIFFGLRPPSSSSLKATQSWSLDGTALVQRRGRLVTVAASPPTEDTVIATEPLTREDLIDYLASGCKPKEKWRIGTEHEKFGFEVGTRRPMKYEQISELLNSISERFDWDKIMEGENIIGLKQGKQSISLEPGGQFEFSGAPLETLHQTCAEVNSHLYQVKAVAEEMGIGFPGIGFQPKWRRENIPVMPKIATALFANSPFTEGKPNGYLRMRSQIWTDTDNNRSGMLPLSLMTLLELLNQTRSLASSHEFEQYVEYALDVPMYFVYRKKKYVDCAGLSFRNFMAGKLPSLRVNTQTSMTGRIT